MALAGAYGTAMAVELEMGPIMQWKTPARGHGQPEGKAGEEEYCPKGKAKRKRLNRRDSGIILPLSALPQVHSDTALLIQAPQ